ncbi:hypothetical protein [Metakosakonia massiliensis]|uniref:Uncharacterized protein n=1 Tax=Phytobacter massiliensis TaxID=1485952 RepID=A0A6N3EGW2_9ENTR
MSEAQEEMGPESGASRGEPLPASELADLAANVSGRPSPAVVWNNADRAALAAEALWFFAERTGLANDSEEMVTVIIDFLADLMHLCKQAGITTPQINGLMMLMMAAEMHVEMEEGEIG